MVWGCISYDGVGRLYHIDGTMDAPKYINILKHAFLGSLRDWDKEVHEVILQQDNDPKHKAHITEEWLDEKGIQVLPWPPQSPDQNPIENLWEVVKDQVRQRNPLPRNKNELWEALVEEWEKIPLAVVRHLYHSIPSRIEALKKAKGGHTKY